MTDRRLRVFVPGKPAPQGSKRYLGTHGGTGKGITVESSKAVAPWRADIREQLRLALTDPDSPSAGLHVPLAGALTVQLVFTMPRPASTPKRSTPPAVKRPDLDKLTRAVLDAIGSAGVWRDDAQVVQLRTEKRLARLGEAPGCAITIEPRPQQSIGDTP